MKKLHYFLPLFFSFVFITVNAQNYDIPPNPKPGKCYKRCFEYDKKFKWLEIDCSELKKAKTKNDLIAEEKNKLKLMKYQEKLKNLGYDVNINGLLDNKTIKAHHKFLKTKKRND